MLGARNAATSTEMISGAASLKIGTAVCIALGADGPGADAWVTWQTWQLASLEGVLCQ